MILNQTDEAAPPGGAKGFSIVRVLLSSAVAGALAVGAFLYELPLLAVRPGPAPNAATLVAVDAPRTESKGSFHLTTVTLAEVTTVEAFIGWASPRISVIPRSAVFPEGRSEEEVGKETAAQMSQSQLSASYAALNQIGYKLEPDGVRVRSIPRDSPAARELKIGDVIVGVDGKKVRTVEDLRTRLGGRKVGDSVRVALRRGSETMDVSIATAESTDGPKRPVIGIVPEQSFKLPLKVAINAEDIGGPSAGLMFALAIVDLLDPEDLTRGKIIAGTGSIDADGKVGGVGGVRQKVVGAKCIRLPKSRDRCTSAQVFFLPKSGKAELDAARRAAGDQIRLIEVSTLKEALAALSELG